MSKMTTPNERDVDKNHYNQLTQVEFLEFIGRIAYAKFQSTELENQLDLAQKIEYCLDDILQLVNVIRNDREEDEEYTETDDSSDNY